MIAGEMINWGRNYKCDINKFWALKMVKITKKACTKRYFLLWKQNESSGECWMPFKYLST
jgi:hypothetical protein